MGPSTAKEETAEQQVKWDDLTYDVRIEKLKSLLINAMEMLERQQATISDLRDKVNNHMHDEQGAAYIKNRLPSFGGAEVDRGYAIGRALSGDIFLNTVTPASKYGLA